MSFNKNAIAKGILYTIAGLGVVTIAIVAPNAFSAFGMLYKSGYSHRQVKRSFNNLEKNKLISLKQEGNQTIVSITKEGRKKLLRFKLQDITIQPAHKWDRKWRLVIFDIPVSKNSNRLAFVLKLKELGFQTLQKSVWVCPYPCEDEIDFLKEIYQIRPHVRLVTGETIDIQSDLLKKFNLTK